jgi:hypothetical protein
MANNTHPDETFESIIAANVGAALDQRGDTKNYEGPTHVFISYLQNAIDTCRGYKINVSYEAVYGAYARELCRAVQANATLTKEFGKGPDGFRI